MIPLAALLRLPSPRQPWSRLACWTGRQFSSGGRQSKNSPWLHDNYRRNRHSDRNRSTGVFFAALTGAAGVFSVIMMARRRWLQLLKSFMASRRTWTLASTRLLHGPKCWEVWKHHDSGNPEKMQQHSRRDLICRLFFVHLMIPPFIGE